MKKILLLVDLEVEYLVEDEYLFLLEQEEWESAREQLKVRFDAISLELEKLKKKGWTIHFTGRGVPYEKVVPFIDATLPWWWENKSFISTYYPKDTKVYLGGIFRERCVHGVNLLIYNSEVMEDLCVSHKIIGDEDFYDANFLIS